MQKTKSKSKPKASKRRAVVSAQQTIPYVAMHPDGMRGAGQRVRQDFSYTEDERSTPTPQVGTCHPTATIREWTGWRPVPRSCRTTTARSVAPSIAVL